MNYAVKQRLRMIDFLLAIYGFVNRSTIMDYFGIGEATATRDFKEYQNLAHGNMTYNGSERAYYKTQRFERVWP